MQDQEQLNPAERELASALSGLRPAAASIRRDRLIFLAGRSSGRRGRTAWQAAAAVLAGLAGVLLVLRPAPREVERIVYRTVDRPVPLPAMGSGLPIGPSASDRLQQQARYLQLRSEVLAQGVSALPQPERPRTIWAEPPVRLEDLLGGAAQTRAKRSFPGLESLIFGDKS